MTETEIVKMCERLAGKYKAPQHYEDLVQEGVLACYELLVEEPDTKPQKLWREAGRRMYDYLNLDLHPLSIPSSDVTRAFARGKESDREDWDDHTKKWLAVVFSSEEVPYEDFMSYVDDHAKAYENQDLVNKVIVQALNNLNFAELSLFYMRFRFDMTLDEVAEEIGTTKQGAEQRLNKITEKVRNNL